LPETAIDWDERHAAGGRWESGEPDQELQRTLQEGWIQPCRALELGCGTGTNAVFLALQGFDVTAADVSEVALRQAEAKAQKAGVSVHFLQSDVLDLPQIAFPPLDFLFDRGCYQHVRRINRFRFREVLARITQPGSLYLSVVPSANESDPRLRPPGALYDYEICLDYPDLFELVQLREFRMKGREVQGQRFSTHGWSILRRRKVSA
jgi:SAM-dependent methyltransferase